MEYARLTRLLEELSSTLYVLDHQRDNLAATAQSLGVNILSDGMVSVICGYNPNKDSFTESDQGSLH